MLGQDAPRQPLAVRGNIPVAALSSIARVAITSHFHRVQEGQFLYSAELRSVLMSTVSFFSPTVADTRIDAIMTSFNDIRINPLARGG